MDIECRRGNPGHPAQVAGCPAPEVLSGNPLGQTLLKTHAAMTLKSLVLCSDEKSVRVLRRVLGDLEIDVELCSTSDSALRRLTRQRYEAIIVDCAADGAPEVLRSSRSAPCNKRAVAVAVVDPVIGLKEIFGLGAQFVLYKPVSSERAKSSFRAARALMKSERRRNVRVPLQIAVVVRTTGIGGNMKVNTIDLSEGGMAVSMSHGRRPTNPLQISFTLPGNDHPLEIAAEFAWEGASRQAGLRFVQTPPESARELKEWLKRNSPETEQDDPPIRCQLTDLSLGGCYLEIASPFLGVLTGNRTLLPELFVQPEGLETESILTKSVPPDLEDPLLQLFYSREPLAAEEFHEALRKQRAIPPGPADAGAVAQA